MLVMPPRMGGKTRVPVRLSDVDIELRVKVADRLIATGKLRGLEAMKMGLAATHPVENPTIRVTEDKAWRVLVERKQPLGPTPKYGR